MLFIFAIPILIVCSLKIKAQLKELKISREKYFEEQKKVALRIKSIL